MYKKYLRKYITFKFFKIRKYFNKNDKIRILDIGAGNHSASKTKELFVNCEYWGVDKCSDYANSVDDINIMDRFCKMDLTMLQFEGLPDDYFDVIIMAHVIEHLFNGDKVIEMLSEKLAVNGIIYLEWPGIRSTRLPSKKGTLNFFDDATHVRIYSLKEIYNLLLSKELKFCEGGVRRSLRLILLIPIKAIWDKLDRGYILASTLWDLLGFAEYCIFRRIS